MKPAPFFYHAPRTVAEAAGLLAQFASEEGRILAGGQTLVPAMALRLARPGHLIDINTVEGLDHLTCSDGVLRIGACVRHNALNQDCAPGPLGRLLERAQHHIAHPPIRARGTFCGSLANADPASEWCCLAILLDGWIEAVSIRGARRIAADDFLGGYMMTALEPDELVVEAGLDMLPPDTRTGFYEFARRGGDFAEAMAAVTYRIEDGVIASARVAVGSIEPRPRRLGAAEAVLCGKKPGPDAFADAASAAAEALAPREDAQDSRALAACAVRRALEMAA